MGHPDTNQHKCPLESRNNSREPSGAGTGGRGEEDGDSVGSCSHHEGEKGTVSSSAAQRYRSLCTDWAILATFCRRSVSLSSLRRP